MYRQEKNIFLILNNKKFAAIVFTERCILREKYIYYKTKLSQL